MAETFTIKIPLGFNAPDFHLTDTISGKSINYKSIKGEKGTLVMFICNHCPYVLHVMDELVRIGKEYMPKGIGFVAINSNDVENYPQDSPELMKQFAADRDFPFPYLYDESQETAKAYQASCTPDYNLFDANDICVYRGQLDASRPGNDVTIDGKDLRAALDAVIAGKKPDENQLPSSGCNIKWKNEDENPLKPLI
ncbi:MAG: thioredoxin family protein [Bacteroidales bacterium]|jgi:thiol-disulfide isomerase/thioredoxin|nr:thioredoxin family protein [Bacteroidales bacterium]